MLRRLAERIRVAMMGRNGQDQLGFAIFGVGCLFLVLSMVIPFAQWSFLCNLISWVLLVLCIFRMWSKNLEARRRENSAFVRFFRRSGDRTHRYFRCPLCNQQVRVPRGRGKIRITCPKCRNKFVKKT